MLHKGGDAEKYNRTKKKQKRSDANVRQLQTVIEVSREESGDKDCQIRPLFL